MHELLTSLIGLVVGFTVGLTGMGGGALMTPLLVLGLGINPLVAVSSDLVTAAVVKPIGATAHLRHGTVHRGLVGWLCAGSIPAAIAGSLVLHHLGLGAAAARRVQVAIGLTLLVAVLAIVAKAIIGRRRATIAPTHLSEVTVRPLATVAIGVLGGFVVSLTSVGSGSLMIVLLLVVYPKLSARQLVSRDLWQAIPLVLTAAVGHAFVGHVEVGLVALLLVGCIPGVLLGAKASAKASDHLVRNALVVVLAASGLKMIGVPAVPVLVLLVVGSGVILLQRSVAKRRSTGGEARSGDVAAAQPQVVRSA
jgi:uncharacterized membrane protein YfcA